MYKLFAFLTLTGLLTACGSAPTIEVGGAPLVYDSGFWEYFSTDIGNGLNIKGDESCWIDLSGSLAQVGNGMVSSEDEGMTYYYYTEEDVMPAFVSFDVGSATLFGSLSLDSPELCLAEIWALSDSN